MALALPLIAAAGEIVAGGYTLTAGEAAATSLGTSVATYYGSKLLKENFNPAVDQVFGKGTAQGFEDNLNDAFTQAEDILVDYKLGLPFGYTNSERQKADKKYKAEHPFSPEETAHLNAYLAQQWLNRPKAEGLAAPACECDTGGHNGEHGATSGPVITEPGTLPGAVTDNPGLDNPSGGGIITLAPSGTGTAGPSGPSGPSGTVTKVPVPTNNGLPLFSSDQINTKELGYSAGQFIIEAVLRGLDDKDGIKKLLVEKPQFMAIASEYMEYVRTRPVLDQTDYQQVKKIYNGKSLNRDDVFVNKEGHFAIVDETGQEEFYSGKALYPKNASTFKAIATGFIPPLMGVWVGPKSYNNDYPVNLVDTYSMMHDIEYNHHGWFYLPGDLKYISRLSQNLGRMGTMEAYVGKFAIKWFSTAGRALALTLGDLPSNVDEVPTPANGIGSFYAYLDNKYKNKSNGSNGGLTLPTDQPQNFTEFGPGYLNQPLNTQGRMFFYQGMRAAAEESWTTASASINPRQSGQNNSLLIDMLRSLKVTEISG